MAFLRLPICWARLFDSHLALIPHWAVCRRKTSGWRTPLYWRVSEMPWLRLWKTSVKPRWHEMASFTCFTVSLLALMIKNKITFFCSLSNVMKFLHTIECNWKISFSGDWWQTNWYFWWPFQCRCRHSNKSLWFSIGKHSVLLTENSFPLDIFYTMLGSRGCKITHTWSKREKMAIWT